MASKTYAPPASKEFRGAVATMQAALLDLIGARNSDEFDGAITDLLDGIERLHESTVSPQGGA
jgi:hypothetical protein